MVYKQIQRLDLTVCTAYPVGYVNAFNEIPEDVEILARNRRTRKENGEDINSPAPQPVDIEDEDADDLV